MTINDFKLDKHSDGSVVVQRECSEQRIHFLNMRAALDFIVRCHVEENAATQNVQREHANIVCEQGTRSTQPDSAEHPFYTIIFLYIPIYKKKKKEKREYISLYIGLAPKS